MYDGVSDEYLSQEEKEKMDILIYQFQLDQYQEFRKNTFIYSKVLKNIYKTMEIYQKSIQTFDAKKKYLVQEEMKVINEGLNQLNFKLREMIYQMNVDSNTIEDTIMEEILRVKKEREYQKNFIRPFLPFMILKEDRII